MKRKFTVILSIVLIAVCIIVFAGCDEKTNTISAYDIAVQNGFVGTEAEWLESLKGADGKDGVDGADGFNGLNGVDKVSNLDIEEIYQSAVNNGYTGDFMTFLTEYLNVNLDIDNTYSVSKAILSAVTIISNFTKNETSWGRPTGNVVGYSSGGAGVIYKLDKGQGSAFIITNFHVVYDASSLQTNHISDNIGVYLYGSEYNEKKISATFVGGSAYYDIAVLRVSESEILKNSDAQAVTVAEDGITVGQTAMAIGFPAGEGMSVTSGIVSVDSETIKVSVDGTNAYSLRVMRVDTAINSGNSGGGLFNSAGELIGIVNAKYNSSTIDNIGYAIPKSIAIGVVDNILYNCTDASKYKVYKCVIGVTPKISESRMMYDTETARTKIVETVMVGSITEGSLSYGILEENDVLLSATLHGTTHTLTRYFQLSDIMLNARVGDVLTIKYSRGGEENTAEITMTEACITEMFVM